MVVTMSAFQLFNHELGWIEVEKILIIVTTMGLQVRVMLPIREGNKILVQSILLIETLYASS